MRVKKFEAKTMKDALRMVKAELGPDAVILGARENKRSFGLGGETSFEITAAVSESTLQKKRFVESRLNDDDRERFRVSGAGSQKKMIDKMVDRRMHTQQVETLAAANRAQALTARPRAFTKVSYIDIHDEPLERTPVFARRARAQSQEVARAQSQEVARAQSQEVARAQSQQGARARTETADRAQSQQGARAPLSRAPIAQAQSQSRQASPARPPQARAASNFSGNVETVQSEAKASSKVLGDVRNRIRNLAREAWEAGRPVEPARPEIAPPQPAPLKAAAQNMDSAPKNALAFQEIDSLKGEIQRLQSLLEGFQKVPQTFQGAAHPGAEFGLAYDFSRSYQKLIETGVNAELAAEILSRAAQEIDPINAKKTSIVEAWVAKWFLQNISICERPLANKVHVFVGPMGGGKTSHLVKTAARLVIGEKKRIAIVSTDTTKVGSVDQLKIYCQILNVPFAVVRDKADWAWLEPQLQNVDHILVDSPGMALTAVEEIQRLRGLMPNSETARIHLCLSSAMKEQDAMEAVRRFRIVQPTDIVFTALDMSVQHGVIATVQLRSGLPLHSFGIGPRVPEDFELATKERVLDLLFKLSNLKSRTAPENF